MAARLGDYVVYGEVRNTHHYSTTGALVLRGATEGERTFVHLNLTGDCAADLRGKHICFWPADGEEAEGPVFPKEDYSCLQMEQVGPTGSMTAAGWVRVMPCSVEEFLRRVELGEPPPTTWQRRLYLEWFGQNGRVVVEMPGAYVEECIREPKSKDDEGEWVELANPTPFPAPGAERQKGGLEITAMEVVGDDVHVQRWAKAQADDDADPADEYAGFEAGGEDDDEPLPPGRGNTVDDPIADLELLDECIEEGEGRPLATLLGDVDRLPRAEDLDDETVEAHLKDLLARMALINVVLDVCEHFTPRDCYRLLLNTIIPESEVFEELIGTGNIQHEMTHEYCPDCDLQFELEARGMSEKGLGEPETPEKPSE